MINFKQAFLDSLDQLDYPAAVKDFLTVTLPEDPGAPASVEDAIIANGHLSQYLIAILDKFVGLAPLELFLHAGQQNQTLQAIAVSGLELVRDPRDFSFELYSPNPNQEFQEGDDVTIAIEVHCQESTSSVLCEIEKDGERFQAVALEYQENLRYAVTIPGLAPDPYQATVTVTWSENDYTQSESVAFFVMES